MTVPALIVVCPFEGEPQVFIDARNEAEKLAVLHWLACGVH